MKDHLPPRSHGQRVVRKDDRIHCREGQSSHRRSSICYHDWEPFVYLESFDETELSKVVVDIQRPADALVIDTKVPVPRDTHEVPFLRHE